MMFRLERTGRFEDDLLDIWDYVAADSQRAADQLIHRGAF